MSALQRLHHAQRTAERDQSTHLWCAGEGDGIDVAALEASEQISTAASAVESAYRYGATLSTPAPQPRRNSISGRFGSSPYSCTATLCPSSVAARGCSTAMIPAVVGTSAARSGFRPSSRSARAGFGPRVILRTRASCARNAGFKVGSCCSMQLSRPPQAFAGEQNEIIAGASCEAAKEVQYRRGVCRIVNGHQRTAQHARAAPLQQRREHVQFACFGDRNGLAGQCLVFHG